MTPAAFDVVEILDTFYQGQLDPYPKAVFATKARYDPRHDEQGFHPGG